MTENPLTNITQYLFYKYYSLTEWKDSSDKENIPRVLNDEKTNCILHDFITEERQRKKNNYKSSISGTIRELTGFFLKLIQPDYNKKQVIQNLIEEKQYSTSYESWYSAALQLDSLNPETVRWKLDKESTLYDYKLIEENLENLRNARTNKDYDTLLYLIRTTWERNLGNMGDLNLYRHSHVGTKKLIEDYLEECILSINELLHESHIDDRILLNIFMQTRKKVGRTALVLSGGGTFGLFHIGVLATLYEHDLLPKVISGSSAGAIVASILCIHKKEEIIGLLEEVLSKSFNIFQDDSEKSESENLLIKVSRFLQNGTWFNNRHLVNTMIGFLGDLTFREAYNKTGKILNVTVSPASVYEQPRLLNNLTAPNVLIWSAVCASCSLPGIFPSTPLYEKDPNTGETKEWNSSSVKFMDGSVDNDLPISRLSEMFNVDHIIACQVNVHVFPFLKLSISCVGGEIEDEISARFKTKLNQISSFCVNEVVHLLEMGTELGIATNLLTKLRSVFLQQYSGDITILPDLKMLLSFNKMLKNPTQNFLLEETIEGARATWPKMSIIKNHCAQEFELDKAITYLKTQIISNSRSTDLITAELPIMGTPLLTGSDHPLHNALNEILSEEEEQLSRESSLSPTLMETLGEQHVISPFVPETGVASPRREHSISLTYTPTGLSNVVNRKRTGTISVLCNPNDVVFSPTHEQETTPVSPSDINPPLKTPPSKKKQKKNKKRRSRK